ncbi:MAG: thiamine-phosphate kinase [Elusimicrobia bacterium]|nr:thiamine-phosphate kinase [Elusimicrobiota bacterium]
MKTLAALGERGLLSIIFKRFSRQRAKGLVLGPGDDAAVLRLTPGRVLVATQDDLAEGTHFETGWADFRRLGHKLFRVNLSDLAAMGDVEPLAVIVSAGFPSSAPRSWAVDFLDGLCDDAKAFRTPVAGGNLSRSSKVFFSMTALGAALPGRVLKRSTARAGDLIAGVGPLGAAAEGLKALKAGRRTGPAIRAFYEPAPQFKAASVLARKGLATSLIDNSDGLARSVSLLAESSGLGAEVDLSRAPVRGDPHAGEDFGLVFTVPPSKWRAVKAALPGAYPVGRMTARKTSLPRGGFDHFHAS